MADDTYFSSPEAAVRMITKLLVKEEFKILAGYYDLSDSEIKLSELESGDFFIRKKRPDIAHPAGFWKYKHPFPPGYQFSSSIQTEKDNVYKVEVRVAVDQGSGIPEQTGFSYFYMIKSRKGWKILPETINED